MKIDAPRAWIHRLSGNFWYAATDHCTQVRIVRESDWRKIMAVVRAADQMVGDGTADWEDDELNAVFSRAIQLRKHLAKRKADREDV